MGSSTNVNYQLGWTYIEQGFIDGLSVQVLDSKGNELANSTNGSLDFMVNSGETFTINVNRGKSTIDSEFRIYGVEIGTDTKEITNKLCE